jgi:hypothetical protein
MTPAACIAVVCLVAPSAPAPNQWEPPRTFTIVTEVPKVTNPNYGCTWNAKTKLWRVCHK